MKSCRLCDHAIEHTFVRKDAKSGADLSLGLCERCGLVQQLSLPSDDALRIYYAHHYREDYKGNHRPKIKYVQRAGQVACERLGFIARAGVQTQGQRLLDIGAGGGEFCYMARKAGFAASGIEPHHGYSEFARQAYEIDVRTCSIADLGEQQAEVITMFHVLEHLANPNAAMAKLWQALSINGHLIVEVPNIHQKDASPHNIYFKAHLFYYSRYSLAAAARAFFEPVRIEEDGNLLMALRRRDQPLHTTVFASLDDVQHTKRRLSEKGWTEYLFGGGGWKKAPAQLSRLYKEMRLPKLSPRELLDRL